jgi:hypothetical protein
MNRTSTYIYLIMAASIIYAFAYPTWGGVSALLNEKQKYNDSLIMVEEIENKKNQMLAEFNNISAADRKEIETILPNSMNFVRLISQIDAVAANYGISIDKITSKEIGSAAGDSIEESQIAQKKYQSGVIGFSFSAPYDKFELFIDDLEKSLRILDMKSFKLSVGEKGQYSYDVEFGVHWFK